MDTRFLAKVNSYVICLLYVVSQVIFPHSILYCFGSFLGLQVFWPNLLTQDGQICLKLSLFVLKYEGHLAQKHSTTTTVSLSHFIEFFSNIVNVFGCQWHCFQFTHILFHPIMNRFPSFVSLSWSVYVTISLSGKGSQSAEVLIRRRRRHRTPSAQTTLFIISKRRRRRKV